MSGTLALLGGSLPIDELGATSSNVKGHFEPLGVLEVTKEILLEMDTCWYDFGPIDFAEQRPALYGQFRAKLRNAIDGSFGAASSIVLKDPRISRFVPLACSALEDVGASPYAIVCYRNPLEVARSLKARNGISTFHGCNLWLRYMLDAENGTRGLPRVFVNFSSFMDDWRSAVDRMELHLGVAIADDSADPSQVDGFLDDGLRHEQVNVDELERYYGKSSLLYRCQAGLETLANDPTDQSAMELLDEVRSSFNENSLLSSETIKEYFFEILDTKGLLRSAEKKLTRFENQRRKVGDLKKAQVKKAQVGAGSRDKDLENKIQSMAGELSDAIQNEQSKTRALQRSLDRVYSSTSWRLTAPLRQAAIFLRKLTNPRTK